MRELARDLWRGFVSAGVFPLHERLKGHATSAVLRRLEESQWRDSARIEADRARRLRAFLAAVQRRVPYYRECFADAGLDPETVSGTTDLQRLPFLDKSVIRSRFDDLRATDGTGLRTMSTGGSSGEPLTFLLGRERIAHDVAAKWRATRWWGVDIGDPEAVVWGSPIEVGGQDRLRALRDRVLRTRLLPAFAMSDQDMDRYLATIRHCRPRMLFGYPSALALLARRAIDRSLPMDDLGIRVAFCTGERLYDEQRDTIREAFDCGVANGYGAREAGFIAHECPRGGMHLSAEDIIVETTDEDGRHVPPGEPGEIVVTHLATGDFPFIRYRTGDVGILDSNPCPCGRGLPLLREVQGRATDFVVAVDGTRLHGLSLIYVLREEPSIASFRIEQFDRQNIDVRVVPAGEIDDQLEVRVRSGFRQRLGDSVSVSIERVDAIPPERSGKYRYVISHAS